MDLPLMHDSQMVRESGFEAHVVEDHDGDHLLANVLLLHHPEEVELQSEEGY